MKMYAENYQKRLDFVYITPVTCGAFAYFDSYRILPFSTFIWSQETATIDAQKVYEKKRYKKLIFLFLKQQSTKKYLPWFLNVMLVFL